MTGRYCIYYIVLITLTITNALPANTALEAGTEPVLKETESSLFQWKNYKIAAITTAIIVAGAGLVALTTLFFPIFAYKICYALGGCQNTLDNYVDNFIGVEGHTRRIKRDAVGDDQFKLVMDLVRLGLDHYANSSEGSLKNQENNQSVESTTEHQIEKRSPIDYIEPILIMISKAYNEYTDPSLKKNFKNQPFIR